MHFFAFITTFLLLCFMLNVCYNWILLLCLMLNVCYAFFNQQTLRFMFLKYLIILCCLKVWDREKIVIIPDHYIFTSDERANRNVDILRDFCTEQSIRYFCDIKDLGNFEVWFSTMLCSFYNIVYRFNIWFTVGTDLICLWYYCPFYFQVPPTLLFVMDGEMPNYLLAKDLILQVRVTKSQYFVSFEFKWS